MLAIPFFQRNATHRKKKNPKSDRIIVVSNSCRDQQPTVRLTIPTTHQMAISDCAPRILDRIPNSLRHVPRQRRLPRFPSTSSLECPALRWCFCFLPTTCYRVLYNTTNRTRRRAEKRSFLACRLNLLVFDYGYRKQTK